MSETITEIRLKWYGHVRRMKDEHILRRILDVDIPGKRRRWRPNLIWKDACKIDMTYVCLNEDKTTNRAAKPATPDDATDREEDYTFLYVLSVIA